MIGPMETAPFFGAVLFLYPFWGGSEHMPTKVQAYAVTAHRT